VGNSPYSIVGYCAPLVQVWLRNPGLCEGEVASSNLVEGKKIVVFAHLIVYVVTCT
jgi:hypothetical protein